MQINSHTQSILPDLSGQQLGVSGSLVVLFTPFSPCMPLNLTPELCCAYLQEGLSQKSGALRPYGPCSRHILSHRVLLPTILGCFYQQSMVGSTAIWLSVFQTYTLAPSLLGFYNINIWTNDLNATLTNSGVMESLLEHDTTSAVSQKWMFTSWA